MFVSQYLRFAKSPPPPATVHENLIAENRLRKRSAGSLASSSRSRASMVDTIRFRRERCGTDMELIHIGSRGKGANHTENCWSCRGGSQCTHPSQLLIQSSYCKNWSTRFWILCKPRTHSNRAILMPSSNLCPE